MFQNQFEVHEGVRLPADNVQTAFEDSFFDLSPQPQSEPQPGLSEKERARR